MCWITYKEPIEQIADKDIIVYKVLKRESNKLTSPVYSSTKWELDKIYSVKLGTVTKGKYDHSDGLVIKKGFHSIIKCPKRRTFSRINAFQPCAAWYKPWINNDNKIIFSSYFLNEYVYKCVIPKGSIYYKNEFGDIVSNVLKIIEEYIEK